MAGFTAETGVPLQYLVLLWEGFEYLPPTVDDAVTWAEKTGVDRTLPVLVDHQTIIGEHVADWGGTNHTRVVLSPDMEIVDTHISLAEHAEEKVFDAVRAHAGL